jgi:hypothetical protein
MPHEEHINYVIENQSYHRDNYKVVIRVMCRRHLIETMSMVNEIEIIYQHNNEMVTNMLPRWKNKIETIRKRQVEERDGLKRAFKILDFIESPKINMVTYLLERINDGEFDKRITRCKREVCVVDTYRTVEEHL